jgi:hypothetical protein
LRVPALTALPRRPSPGKDGQGDMI